MTAYDYTKQKWVQGPAARGLLIAQKKQTLSLLFGNKGQSYADDMGVDRLEAIHGCQRALIELEAHKYEVER